MSQDEKKQRAERFQNYIKAGNQNMTDDGAENYVKDIVSGEWHLFNLSLIHISEPTRRTPISYAVFCLKKKKKRYNSKTSS